MGALKSFVSSDIQTSKILLAKVPIRLPSDDFKIDVIEKLPKQKTDGTAMKNMKNESIKPEYDKNQLQQDLRLFGIEFLDFSNRMNHSGTVCKDGLCCHYDIDVSKNDDASNEDNRVCLQISVLLMRRNINFCQFVFSPHTLMP